MADFNEMAIALTNLIVGRIVVFLLALLGTVTNSINIAVFQKQGFKDSITISLFTISVLDLIRCAPNVILRLDWLLGLVVPPYVLKSFQNFVTFFSFNMFAPVGSLVAVMTAYVSLERCLAVCIPLKVKQVITPKVTSIVLISSGVVVTCSYLFNLCALVPVLEFSPKYNETILINRQDFCNLDWRSFKLLRSGVKSFWGMSTFVVIAVCTVIIIVRMRASARFRFKSHAQTSFMAPAVPTLSTRDRQMIKVLLLINVIHLVGNGPNLFLAFILRQITKKYYPAQETIDAIVAIIAMFSIFNASVNFFVYCKVSSNFKTTLNILMKRPQNP